jgi:hypothetical protein
MGSREEGFGGGGETFADGKAFGCLFDDGSNNPVLSAGNPRPIAGRKRTGQ